MDALFELKNFAFKIVVVKLKWAFSAINIHISDTQIIITAGKLKMLLFRLFIVYVGS